MKRIFTFAIVLLSLAAVNAQEYQPVADKSSVSFSIKNFGIYTGGDFKGLEGTIVFDKANPEKSSFDMHVDAATVNTDNSSRDSHLKKEEYFDVSKYPRISFKSEKITGKNDAFNVTGSLTIKGTSKTVSFPFTATSKEDGVLFQGSFKINRRDFKVGSNSLVLGDEVIVKLVVLARRK